MPTIKISDAVWAAIAERGKFGESEDDVLSRVFELDTGNGQRKPGPALGRKGRGNHRIADKLMRSRVIDGKLLVEFDQGPTSSWELPNKSDKEAIKRVREDAVAFALKHGASDPGQTNAVRKALTDAGYYISR